MNYLIQHGKVRGQIINVPAGFPELLSDVTREVLRCQPTTECLCQFIIDYLHSLIVAREKAKVAKSVIDRALVKVDEVISGMCICDLTKEKCEEMSAMMEECFKKFLEKRRCEERTGKEMIKFQEMDMLDELIRKCKFTEQELKVSRPLIEEAYERFVQAYMTAAENSRETTEALYEYFLDRENQRKETKRRTNAAIRIQSNFRGFMVRRVMFEDKRDTAKKTVDFGSDFSEMNKAAIKIQRFFRHASRDNLQQRDSRVWHIEQQAYADVCSPPSLLSLAPKPVHVINVPPQNIIYEQPSAPKAAQPPPVEVAKPPPPPVVQAPPPPPPEEPKVQPPPPPPPAVPEPEPEPEPVAAEEPAPEAEKPAEEAEAPPAEPSA